MNRCFLTDDGIKIVGDPHLGKVFMNGVPLARRGERERLQRQAFLQALDPQGARRHVVLGDLFDRPKVSFETIFFAAEAYRASDPQVEFFILAGNHDLSRDSTQVSALQLFQMMVPNVHVLTKPTRIGDDLLAIPWSPWKSAAQVVGEINDSAVTVF